MVAIQVTSLELAPMKFNNTCRGLLLNALKIILQAAVKYLQFVIFQ